MIKNIAKAALGTLAFALVALPGAASAQSHNRVVAIHNTDSISIYYVYITNTGVNTWGNDWLDDDVIISDETMNFNIDDHSGACRFDLKVKYKNGVERQLRDINVCSISHIDANTSGITVAN